MKNFFLSIKTLIVELVGLFGGFFWAKSTNWDYEPIILFIISLSSLLITLVLLYLDRNNELVSKPSSNHSNKIPEKKLQKETVSDNSSDLLDAKTIQAEIEKSAPFLKHQVESNYIGMEIKWGVTFHSIGKNNNNIYHVTTRYKGKYPWIYFDIDVEKYPIFKIGKKDQFFVIEGKIIKIGGNTFTVNIDKIYES